MNDAGESYTNRCGCGWEITGTADEVVDATIEHGRRMHNMEATRDQVLAAISLASGAGEMPESRAG
jgi:predicted small metal-binding protein